MIVTFYSYKGGVGRSMALANVAEWYRQLGLRVVMVDWDLEAPGLETFFVAGEEARAAVRARLGLVDLLHTYRELFPGLARSEPGPAAADDAVARRTAFVDLLGEALPPLRHLLVAMPPPPGSNLPPLWLLPAGNRSPERFDSYAETVQQFDWSAFYAHYEGEAFFEWIRRQLLDPKLADVVLIDSRTGVTEMSGVCTRQLADAVVMLCAPNDQNLDGVAKMARSFTRPELAAARAGGPLRLLMVPSRLDVSEGRPIDVFEARFRSRLDAFLPDALRGAGTDFLQLRIPYISAYAFDERLAVGDPQGVKALQQAYGSLATHLALLAPSGKRLHARCALALRERFGLPAVVVLALEPAHEAAAASVRRALDNGELIVLPEPADAAQAEALLAEIGAVQRQGLSLLVITDDQGGPAAALRSVRQRCRELGVAMLPLAAPAQGPVLADADAWAQLRLSLRRATAAPRVPMLAPPPFGLLVGRDGEVGLLRRALVGSSGGSEQTVALVGPGGTGKTALARTIARDEAVVEHFDGGVLWLTLGSRPDLVTGLAKIVAAFEGGTAVTGDLDDLLRRATAAMRARRCLTVVEDVETATVLESVPRGGPGSMRLVTTRSGELAAMVGVQTVDLSDGLAHAVAVELLGLGGGAAPAAAGMLVDLLGGVPLALKLAGGQLKAATRKGLDGDAAIADLIRRLQRDGVEALDAGVNARTDSSLYAALMAETESLRSIDRQRLSGLADLPPGQPYGLTDASAALALSPQEAGDMLARLQAIGWVTLQQGRYTTHALPHAALRSLSRREDAAQKTRIMRRTPAGLRLYLSYRRMDTVETAVRVYARLAEEFGATSVFFDRDDLAPGEDWNDRGAQAVMDAAAVIALIGPLWSEIGSAVGGDDWVVAELSAALSMDKRVIPVLVQGAAMPSAASLPGPLRALATRQALEVRAESFNRDLDRLVEVLHKAASEQRQAPQMRSYALADAMEALPQRQDGPFVQPEAMGAKPAPAVAGGIWKRLKSLLG